MVWEETHVSAHDGSPVRVIATWGNRITCENENGDTWEDDASEWLPIGDQS